MISAQLPSSIHLKGTYVSLFSVNRMSQLILGVFFSVGILVASTADASGSRDILWDIVSNCLDTSSADYCSNCRWPRADSTCPAPKDCRSSTEVWAESADFVVLRDSKMCGCPKDFIHGLTLPRAKVAGVEDPSRPDGIWQFAWDAAIGRVKDTANLALVVNPPGKRSQDQLHIHSVRLADDARQRMARRPTVDIKSLDEVWSAASKSAAAQGLTEYGVLVVQSHEGGFRLIVERENPEKKYTRFRCR